MSYTEIKECLACGSSNLIQTLDLKNQPLANSYTKSKEEVLEEFPLIINRCSNCNHVQLSVSVNPDLMFKDYLYVSGTSRTMIEHFDWFAKYSVEYFKTLSQKTKDIRVLDIGCNDGSQLDKYKALGCNTLGVDPAENLWETSSKKHKVVCGYFNEQFTQETQTQDIIVAQNVFAHNYGPEEFMKNVKFLMDETSLFFVQTSQANMILNNEFDTIYHEHISFYNINSMKELCNRSGLNLIDVIKCPLHGTSYVFVISKSVNRDSNVANLIEMENNAGLYSDNTYIEYEKKCVDLAKNLKDCIDSYKERGYKIIGYGAAAKGNTLLNFTKVVPDYIIDDNPLKHNHYTPGSKVEIVPIDILDDFDNQTRILFVPLAWNFFKEIKSKIKTKRDNENDEFLLFFPSITVSK